MSEYATVHGDAPQGHHLGEVVFGKGYSGDVSRPTPNSAVSGASASGVVNPTGTAATVATVDAMDLDKKGVQGVGAAVVAAYGEGDAKVSPVESVVCL